MSAVSGRSGELGLLVGVAIAGLGALWLVAGMLSFPGSEGWGYDYRAYTDAAVRLADSGSLYQPETLEGRYRPGPYGLYLYAPPLGIAVTPLAEADLDTGVAAWFVLRVVALMAACALLPVSVPVRLASFGVATASYPVSHDLALGNVSTLLLLPLAMTWRWLDRPLGQAALAVAMSVRPTVGIVLVWQLLRRQWRAVAWAALAGLGLIALTLPFVGLGSYVDYVTVLRNMSDVTGVRVNHDLGSAALDLGAGSGVARLALLGGYAIAIAAMLLSLRRDRELGFVVTVAGSLLLSPLLWDHYLAMLVLPAAFLAQHGRPWAIFLPLLAWLPVLLGTWTVLYPLIAIVAMFLPFLARDRLAGPRARPVTQPATP